MVSNADINKLLEKHETGFLDYVTCHIRVSGIVLLIVLIYTLLYQ